MLLELDKADKNSQRPETQDAMRKTMEREREAKDQIMEQVHKYNKYARKGGRRQSQTLNWLSKIDPSSDPKAENTRQNGREERQTARDWDPRTHEENSQGWDPRTHDRKSSANSRRTKAMIYTRNARRR